MGNSTIVIGMGKHLTNNSIDNRFFDVELKKRADIDMTEIGSFERVYY